MYEELVLQLVWNCLGTCSESFRNLLLIGCVSNGLGTCCMLCNACVCVATVLQLDWNSFGTVPALCWNCLQTVSELFANFFGNCFGTVFELCWNCFGTVV